MAKINETYEAMVVFSLKQGEDGIKALTEKFKGMMAEAWYPNGCRGSGKVRAE